MKKNHLIPFLALLAFPAIAQEAGEPTPFEKAARDFAFEGIRMGAALAQFKKDHPTAEFNKEGSDLENGVSCYALDSQKASLLMLYFFDGKLCEIRVFYLSKVLDKMGGVEPVIKQMVKKFGAPDAVDLEDKNRDKNEAIWRFKGVSRHVSLLSSKDKKDQDVLVVDVTDTDLMKKASERKQAKAKTGLED